MSYTKLDVLKTAILIFVSWVICCYILLAGAGIVFTGTIDPAITLLVFVFTSVETLSILGISFICITACLLLSYALHKAN